MWEVLATIHDPRHPGYVKHKLSDVLLIIICAVMSGLDELCTIYAYAQNKEDFFRTQFGIESIPSKPTLSRILGMVNPKSVTETMINLMKEQIGQTGEVIAVDGKAIRSTSEAGKAHSALQILTAYLTENSVILAQDEIHEKTNEIPVFQEMLDHLDINGRTVTADAMHCQRETCAKIVKRGGKYIFGLKENQKTLYKDVSLYFQDAELCANLEISSTTEKNKGRYEKRTCRKLTQLDWLEQKERWPGLSSILEVERVVTTGQKTSREVSYYISSSNISAEHFLNLVREHWKIESMHWMLDVVFCEDDCIMKSDEAHLNLNIFRKYAIAMHRKYLASQQKKCSVKSNMLSCLMNDSLLLKVIESS